LLGGGGKLAILANRRKRDRTLPLGMKKNAKKKKNGKKAEKGKIKKLMRKKHQGSKVTTGRSQKTIAKRINLMEAKKKKGSGEWELSDLED